ncbi:hypothetical protein ACFWNK_13385 [Streptomyces sp. NPDC058417]|uniref:hypothetical protein n=1 Tax=unclassified Streptomyces TaxID=2593676 RepID=UPI003663A67C
MSFNRGRFLLPAVAAGAAGASAKAVRPLSAQELAAALPTEASAPGFRIVGTPTLRTGGSTWGADAEPEVCRPLWEARAGGSDRAVASASLSISHSDTALESRFLTFASLGPGQADAFVASVGKALASCASTSFVSSRGNRVTTKIEKVADPGIAGYDAVSFRMRWHSEIDGFAADTYILVTTLRAGDATLTEVADISLGSRLSAARQRAFVPKLYPDPLKAQADSLREAQSRTAAG